MTSAEPLIAGLRAAGMHLAIAESLTGGLLADAFVSVPGASDVLLGSLVAYSSDLKRDWLGVSGDLLSKVGAVDAWVAKAMAEGVRSRMAASCGLGIAEVLGLAVTGVAGPNEQDGQLVGTVFAAIAGPEPVLAQWQFAGGREEIRRQAVTHCLEMLREVI